MTIEAFFTGLIIAIIGLIATQAYASYKGHTGKIEKDFVLDNFWGMATSFFVIGYLAEYSARTARRASSTTGPFPGTSQLPSLPVPKPNRAAPFFSFLDTRARHSSPWDVHPTPSSRATR